MVITAPNKFAAEVHDRMPVILKAKAFEMAARRSEGRSGAYEACRRGNLEVVVGVEACKQFKSG